MSQSAAVRETHVRFVLQILHSLERLVKVWVWVGHRHAHVRLELRAVVLKREVHLVSCAVVNTHVSVSCVYDGGVLRWQ